MSVAGIVSIIMGTFIVASIIAGGMWQLSDNITSSVNTLRLEIKGDMKELRGDISELKVGLSEVRGDLSDVERRLTESMEGQN